MLVGEIAAAFARSAICRTHADGFKLAAAVKGPGEDESRRGRKRRRTRSTRKRKKKKKND